MSKNHYIGIDGKARRAVSMYMGVDNIARKVKKVYIGVDGKARLVMTSDIVLGDVIPEGGTYYTGVTATTGNIGDYSVATTTLNAGDPFPETPSVGDIFVFGDYEYRYCCATDNIFSDWRVNNEMNGWGVCLLDTTKTTYDGPLATIVGQALVSISKTFRGCTNLLTMPEIPSSVVSASHAFTGCDSLTSVVIPEGLTNTSYMFSGCDNLVDIVFPSDIKHLNNTFSQCSSLERMIIPYGVESISGTFWKCENLIEVHIPDSVTLIGGSGTFRFCYKLEKADIPDSVETIGDYAFHSCTEWDSAIPDSVTYIGEYAFSRSGIRVANIPEGITDLLQNVFEACHRLEHVVLPNSLKTIGYSAFTYCSALTSIIIPENVTKIKSRAFCSCDALSTVEIFAKTPPTLESSGNWNTPFYENPSLTQIIVPVGCAEAYKAAAGWSEHADIIVEKEA